MNAWVTVCEFIAQSPVPSPRPTQGVADAASGGAGGLSIAQLLPLLAALIALAGVATTLYVTGKRDRSRFAAIREDDYRREQRTAVAAVATAAQRFRRDAGALGDPSRYLRLDFAGMTELKNAAESASLETLTTLTVARLLVHDYELQGALDGLFSAWSEANASLTECVGYFWDELPEEMTREAAVLQQKLRDFGDRAAVLQSIALDTLKPTVVELRG